MPQLTLPVNYKINKNSILEKLMFKFNVAIEDRIFIKQLLQQLLDTNKKMSEFFELHSGLYVEEGLTKGYTDRKYFNIFLYNKERGTKRQYHVYYSDDHIYDITCITSIMNGDSRWSYNGYKHRQKQ